MEAFMSLICKSTCVPQADLERLQTLRQIGLEEGRLRNEIKCRLEAGAEIEPGPLTVRFEHVEQRRWTRQVLSKILAAEWIAKIQKVLPATSIVRLLIEPAKPRNGEPRMLSRQSGKLPSDVGNNFDELDMASEDATGAESDALPSKA
jgi:hypothetical protein